MKPSGLICPRRSCANSLTCGVDSQLRDKECQHVTKIIDAGVVEATAIFLLSARQHTWRPGPGLYDTYRAIVQREDISLIATFHLKLLSPSVPGRYPSPRNV